MTDNLIGGYTREALARPASLKNIKAWLDMDGFSVPWQCDAVRYILQLETMMLEREEDLDLAHGHMTNYGAKIIELKRSLDAIADALGQRKWHKSERTEMGLEDDLSPSKEYLPDQLAEMVRELRERHNEMLALLFPDDSPEERATFPHADVLATIREFEHAFEKLCDVMNIEDRATEAERELAALRLFEELVRDAGLPEQWEIDHPAMRYVTIQVDKDDWLKCREHIAAHAASEATGDATAK